MDFRAIYRGFRANKRAYVSLWIFGILVVLSLCAPFIANQKPLFIYHNGAAYFPVLVDYPEKTFGGDFESFTDYLDPYVSDVLLRDSFVLRTLVPYSDDSILFDLHAPSPTPPDSRHWLGTDDKGRDVLSRMLYGLRTSLAFGFVLSLCVLLIGMSVGALQGYYGGGIDLFGQRLIEIWNSIPVLFVIIIVANTIAPSFWWILAIVLTFSWIGLAGVVRAEVLKVRNLEFIKAAKVLGFSDWYIIMRHILPNAMVATITYLPFIMASGIITLGSLDFLGFGTQEASLGELLAQGKNNLTSPHLGISSFVIVSVLLSVLVFIGEGLRDALDPKGKVKAQI